MKRRGSGILLHITSLPSPFGIGDLGSGAYRFIDFLAEAKQSYWQVLPLNPTDPIHYNSPYHSTSAFAFNPLLISPELMIAEGFLKRENIESFPEFPQDRVDHLSVKEYKENLFNQAFTHFKRKRDQGYLEFCSQNAHWLEDFALFVALKANFQGKAWSEWPPGLRDRNREALESAKSEHQDKIEKIKFLQYIFNKQWASLKNYCTEKSIQIIGDLPIYVDYDSADVWAHPELFKLDDNQKPYVVAGVPPDYFSATGQLWGNPIYRWDILKERDYDWWVKRIAHSLKLYDFLRIDHFRGFVAYWEVPAREKTAINGKWIEAPAIDFFTRLTKKFPYLPIIAEDLGVITPDVREVMNHFELPGMKLLLFAFGPDLPTNPYIPHNLGKNCIAYTGTHDNNTIRGWFEKEVTPEDKKRLFKYLSREVPAEEIHWELIRLVMMSVANTVIFPLQDILGLGEEARMNLPATREGNWKWRLLPNQITPDITKRLLEMTEIYGRA
ncbi:MAG: 4-alpha-glucanotransferase [Pseudomonadota bacterium]